MSETSVRICLTLTLTKPFRLSVQKQYITLLNAKVNNKTTRTMLKSDSHVAEEKLNFTPPLSQKTLIHDWMVF